MTTSVKIEIQSSKPEVGRESFTAAPVNIGDRVDHYRIDALVARTAMATTFRGTDLRDGRSVAIKIPHLGAEANPAVREQFRREEAIGGMLNHPGVVRVLRDEYRSEFYLVRAWAEGHSLRDILDEEGRLTPARATLICVNICETLYYVHSRGVVHRDLKPENILVDSADQITLIDFGIAVEGGAQGLAVRKSSEAIGTPDYISPEEVKGIRGNARSDLYALGIMLYEMVAGRTPFEGCNPLVVMNGRLLEDPIPIRMLTPYVSRGLEAVIERALQRDPRRRYASAIEFARDLERQNPVARSPRADVVVARAGI
jgi:serine/threonine protein kinase